MKLNLKFVAISLLASILVSVALAESERIVELKPTKLFPKASGQAVIRDKGNQKQITISVKGLQPGGTYSALLARDHPPQESQVIGKGETRFRADRNGNAQYEALADAAEFWNWDAIDIIYHKGNAIKDTGESSFIVLKGFLIYK
jgi:hypothetical protein